MWLVSILVSVCVAVYAYFKWRYGYWERRNIPSLPAAFPFGNFKNILTSKTSFGIQIAGLYEKFRKNNSKHGGFNMILEPIYMPVDCEIVKAILIKDHNHFVEKSFYINEKDQPISAHLFAIGGDKWKALRQKLTPTFTSGKMKMMFQTVRDCRLPMLEELKEISDKKIALDVKELGAKFTTDIIGSVAFGIECNSFKDPDAEFRKCGKDIFHINIYRMFKAFFSFAFKDLSVKLGIVPLSSEAEAFFTKTVEETIAYREKNNVTRNDFMQLLINIKNKGSVDGDLEDASKKITKDELVAQAFVFFIAGFETSSTTMTFCMLELAQNQEIQDKVRREIREVLERHQGEITYDALNELIYMKQVIDEALRMYPPLPTIDRKCTKDYKIPNTDAVLEAGTSVTISAFGLQRDPKHFPDPLKFNPDRFSKENIHKIKECTYLPFGEGPRQCIGLRFGLMQTKVGLLTLLKDYRYTLSKKTNPNVEFSGSFVLAVEGDVFLDVERL